MREEELAEIWRKVSATRVEIEVSEKEGPYIRLGKRPKLVVPRKILDMDEAEVEAILAHEAHHLERGGPWRKACFAAALPALALYLTSLGLWLSGFPRGVSWLASSIASILFLASGIILLVSEGEADAYAIHRTSYEVLESAAMKLRKDKSWRLWMRLVRLPLARLIASRKHWR